MVEPEPLAHKEETAVNGFEVHVKIDDTMDAGFGLDLAEGLNLRISRIYAKGKIPEYNVIAPPEKQVKVGDFIVAINAPAMAGEGTPAEDLVQKLKQGGEMTLSVRRPMLFTITKLDRKSDEKGLGLDLSFHPRGMCAKVRKVFEEGVVPRYNKTVPTEKQVQSNDCIVLVNGQGGSAKDMVEALGKSPTIDIVIARPAKL